MNSSDWQQHFESNRLNRPTFDWQAKLSVDPDTARVIGRSLAHFQLGESGEGRRLLHHARVNPQTRHDTAYRQALELFIAEEHEHARLLALLVQRYGGRIIHRHWTHTVFRQLRNLLGLDFEVQILVTAELIGTAYYRLLGKHTTDPVLQAACACFLHDEGGHVAFHIDRLHQRQQSWLPLERQGWTVQFQAVFLAAVQAAWVDHRGALLALGISRAAFTHEARQECRELLERLSTPTFAAYRTGGAAAGRNQGRDGSPSGPKLSGQPVLR